MLEKTLVFIKPAHVELADKILAELDQHGNRIKTARLDEVPREVVEEHYSVHKGKFFYDYLVAAFAGKPVVLAFYEGEDIINRFREIIGSTDPRTADPKSIRARYSEDSLETAISEGRPVHNVIHCSDSLKGAARELEVWKAYL